MKPHKKLYILTALSAALVFGRGAAAAQNSIYYALGDSAAVYGTGTSKAETYNVAIHISEPSLVGAAIKGVRVAFPYAEGLSDASAWLSEELPQVKSRKVTAPDVTSKAFTLAKGYTYVAFDEPYILTASGVYVGYAFTTEASSGIVYPVVVTAEDREGGLFVHSTSTFRTAWHNLSAEGNGALAIQVLVEGDAVKGDAASLASVSLPNLLTGLGGQGSFTLVNHGANGISSVDYTLTLGSQTEERHYDLAQPVEGVYSSQTVVPFDVDAQSAKGTYDLSLKVTHVNGQPNADQDNEAQSQLFVYNTLPKHRPVLEEYTGTWCGYCPRGFVGLEEMERLYPNDFIGISYHNGDPMEVISSGQYPWNTQVLGSFPGYPAASLDRIYDTDAYCGFGPYYHFGIDQAWLSVAEAFAPAAVEVESQWTDDETLLATAHVTFPLDRADCPYEVGFVLTADGLSGTGGSWDQSNYYASQAGQWPSSMDEFTQGSSYVSGLTYNFVFVARSGIEGIEGSLAAPVVADEAQDVSYSFSLPAIKNSSSQPVVQDKDKLCVIALLFDKQTGAVVNANKAWAGTSSLMVTDIVDVQRTTPSGRRPVFSLQGIRVEKPSRGLYIVEGKVTVVR